MFEYPLHNFDVAHASQTGNALHRGPRRVVVPLTSSRWEGFMCTHMRSNFDLESHHDPHRNSSQDESTFGQMPLDVGEK